MANNNGYIAQEGSSNQGRGGSLNAYRFRQAMNMFKNEVATELGLQNYDQLDKGALTSRQNGTVGGTMVRTMIDLAEEAIAAGTVPDLFERARFSAQPLKENVLQYQVNIEMAQQPLMLAAQLANQQKQMSGQSGMLIQ